MLYPEITYYLCMCYTFFKIIHCKNGEQEAARYLGYSTANHILLWLPPVPLSIKRTDVLPPGLMESRSRAIRI